jgi:hypothetical protein
VEAGYDTERRQFGFAFAGQDVDLGAADALGFGNEGLAILGIAAGGGRDRPELGDLHAIAQGAKAPQRGECLVDGIGRQQAGGQHLAPEPGQHLLVEDRRGAASEPLVDYEPHRVRADVDDGHRRPVIETTLRVIHGGAPPLTSGRDGV